MGSIYGIAVKPQKKGPMQLVPSISVSVTQGLHGDIRGAGGADRARQITLLSYISWTEACDDMGLLPSVLPWTARRANICVRGMVFTPQDIGRRLQLGEAVILEITGEAKPCARMDEVRTGLQAVLAIDMRAGVSCRVVAPGEIYTGDCVLLRG